MVDVQILCGKVVVAHPSWGQDCVSKGMACPISDVSGVEDSSPFRLSGGRLGGREALLDPSLDIVCFCLIVFFLPFIDTQGWTNQGG